MSCSFKTDDSPCGAAYFAVDDATIIPLQSCTDDITGHLRFIRIAEKTSKLSEWELILNRAGHFKHDDQERTKLTICPKHRSDLGRNWSGARQNQCKYPGHTGKKRTYKDMRRANQSMSEQVFEQYKATFPIGSGKLLIFYFCKTATLNVPNKISK